MVRRLRFSLILASVGGFVALFFAIQNFSYPSAVYKGLYSDHYSHLNSTILFWVKGLDIYRYTVLQNTTPSQAEKDREFSRLNELNGNEVFVNPMNPARRPLNINWPFQIRPYPPGVFVLFSPLAVMQYFEWFSFRTINIFTILMLIGLALGAVYIMGCFFEGGVGSIPLGVTTVCASAWILCWAVRGFYDPASLLFVILALLNFHRGKWLRVFLFYSIAIFLHYRALYYLPLVALALWNDPNRLRWVRAWEFWLGAFLSGFSLICFWVAYPQLQIFAGNNPVLNFKGGFPLIWGLAAFCLLGSLRYLNLLQAALLLCYSVFLLRTPQTYPWHTLFLIPLLLNSAVDVRGLGKKLVWATTIVWVVVLSVSVYGVDKFNIFNLY